MIDIKDCLVSKNVSLKNFCTFKIGGNAKLLFECFTTSSLLECCKYCEKHSIKFKVIGLGANLLFDDAGYNGAIIVNRTQKVLVRGNHVYADSGIPISNLLHLCSQKSLTGIESLAGIPATIGGAVFNSLSSSDSNFSDFIEWVECFRYDDLSKPICMLHKDCEFNYRTSIFKNNDYIITRVKLSFLTSNQDKIKEKISSAVLKKISTQPLNKPSAGSIFKRGGIIPSKEIDKLGLKGFSVGDAQVSNKHAGFIINSNSATSKDVKSLIEILQKKLFKVYKVTPQLEIEYVDY